MTETDFEKYKARTYSYMTLRKVIGLIGILLPFVLVAGDYMIFGESFIRESISDYYNSKMIAVFVGALSVVGFFLFFYVGDSRTDNWLGNVAGTLAVITVLFPTDEGCGEDSWVSIVHRYSSGAFFLCLAIFAIFLFRRTDSGKVVSESDTKRVIKVKTKRKAWRNRVYLFCGIVLLSCMLVIIGFSMYVSHTGLRSCDYSVTFWCEATGMVAFGTAWIVKGEMFLKDHPGEDYQVENK